MGATVGIQLVGRCLEYARHGTRYALLKPIGSGFSIQLANAGLVMLWLGRVNNLKQHGPLGPAKS